MSNKGQHFDERLSFPPNAIDDHNLRLTLILEYKTIGINDLQKLYNSTDHVRVIHVHLHGL
jgi:hypothetical protein